MTIHSTAVLTERLLKLSPLEFETFVYRLVSTLAGATGVQRNSRFGGTEIDVDATVNGEHLIFEAKRLATLTLSRADAIVAFADRAREATGARRFVLVAPARLSPDAARVLRNNNVEHWGVDELSKRTDEGLWRWLESGSADGGSNPEPARSKAESLTAALDAIPPGNVEALDFQKLWLDAAEFLFSPPLAVPQWEVPDAEGRNRRDIIIENFTESGFWSVIRSEYVARYVVIDAKNYREPVGKRSVLDVAHYLKGHGCGLFAILATRAGARGSARHAIREHWIAEKKLILVVDDADLKRMLVLRADGADPSAVIRERLREFIFSM